MSVAAPLPPAVPPLDAGDTSDPLAVDDTSNDDFGDFDDAPPAPPPRPNPLPATSDATEDSFGDHLGNDCSDSSDNSGDFGNFDAAPPLPPAPVSAPSAAPIAPPGFAPNPPTGFGIGFPGFPSDLVAVHGPAFTQANPKP